jgi:cytochrome c oxidase subunit II
MKVAFYEKVFLGMTAVMLVAFLGALGVSVLAAGVHLPEPSGRVDPAQLFATPPFDQPGLKQLGSGRYQVVMIGQMWAFTPNEIRVPRGSTVTFTIASRDLVHGFNIEGTNANIMLVPGQVSTVTVQFRNAGEHLIICHEYCGLGHHQMYGRIIVE